MYDIVIIGGGPAGITAGIYAVRAGKKVVVLEASHVGGKILQAHMVDNYPGVEHITGEELGKVFYEQALNLGVEIKMEKAMSIMDMGEKKVVQTLDNTYETKAVILATGNDKRELNVPGEKDLIGKGVSYCATCDGNFFKKKTVAIVGGGEESVDDCLYLANLCEKVYFIYDRKMDVSKLDKENIEILADAKVVKVNGTNRVESITISRNNKNEDIEVSGLFVAIASVPETSYLLNGLTIDPNGNVIAGEDLLTNKEGIYVAGDLRVKSLRQVATAVSDGAVAATAAIRYLNSLKKESSFRLSVHKKNLINETNIYIDSNGISYTSVTKAPGMEEEQVEEYSTEDKEIIKNFITKVYEKNKTILVTVYDNVKKLDKLNRSKNTATNDLKITDGSLKMAFDCYIQEYENVPSLFTVEVEKFIKEVK